MVNTPKTFTRRPLVFEIDSYDRSRQEIKKHKMLIPAPIGGNFKVSNGKFLCDITINESGVVIKTVDQYGRVKILSTD